jgi:uncharacterized protein YeeX (DUF496 family)
MPYTAATMRNSSKETRKNRKRLLRDRIKKTIKRYGLTEEEVNSLISQIRSDLDELIEIGVVEGKQQGYNEALQKLKSGKSISVPNEM